MARAENRRGRHLESVRAHERAHEFSARINAAVFTIDHGGDLPDMLLE
jgi:hypothetical protein